MVEKLLARRDRKFCTLVPLELITYYSCCEFHVAGIDVEECLSSFVLLFLFLLDLENNTSKKGELNFWFDDKLGGKWELFIFVALCDQLMFVEIVMAVGRSTGGRRLIVDETQEPRFSDELNVIKEGENIRSPIHYRQQMDP